MWGLSTNALSPPGTNKIRVGKSIQGIPWVPQGSWKNQHAMASSFHYLPISWVLQVSAKCLALRPFQRNLPTTREDSGGSRTRNLGPQNGRNSHPTDGAARPD